jgi:hypothetical protein
MQALDAGLLAAAAHDLGDAASGQRLLLADPQRRQGASGMLAPHPEIAVERLGRPMAER